MTYLGIVKLDFMIKLLLQSLYFFKKTLTSLLPANYTL